MSSEHNGQHARGPVVWGWVLVALGLVIVVSSGMYLWNENVWIGTVGAAGSGAPSSIPLYLDALAGLIVGIIGLVLALRWRGVRP